MSRVRASRGSVGVWGEARLWCKARAGGLPPASSVHVTPTCRDACCRQLCHHAAGAPLRACDRARAAQRRCR
jgi:hypothetical protein